MAGNFWASSHYQQWILDRQDLYRERHNDLTVITEEDYQKIIMLFANVIQALGEQLKFRQQVIATATIYFKRFYARNSLKCIDPWLMAPTCAFLASKVEEFGVISNSRLMTACQSIVKNKFSHAFSGEYPYRTQHVLECEFYLLEMMGKGDLCVYVECRLSIIMSPKHKSCYKMTKDCCLIMYHPYRPLVKFCADLNAEGDLLPVAWKMVNDSLRTDAPLLYPPYLIALACLHLAAIVKQKDIKSWCAELNVDIDKCMEITKMMVSLYEMWKTYDEKKEIQAILSKMPKPSPSRPPSEATIQDNSQQQQPSQQQLSAGVS